MSALETVWSPADAALYVDAVSVRFGGVQAVNEATITALPGQVTGLIGPNGAGKTTTFNVITGLETPTAGRVFLGGQDVSRLSPYKRARLGLARTFQRLEVFGTLTAYENVLAAAEFRRSWGGVHPPPPAGRGRATTATRTPSPTRSSTGSGSATSPASAWTPSPRGSPA